ncbi:MAG: FAD-dependent oxidoreductase [Planctomycetota bacterium]
MKRHGRHPVTCEVAIVGAGPVGLFLGCCLQELDISCLLLEKNAGPLRHSRSIGIHPPCLELFARLGLAGEFLAQGVRIVGGRAFGEGRQLGFISFEGCPGPFNYVLALPQYETERILEEALPGGGRDCLLRGLRILGIAEGSDRVYVEGRDPAGRTLEVRCHYVVGCDGRSSQVRELAGIAFEGMPYPDTYVMGDFTDCTSSGNEAHIFLGRGGVVESFPLPGGIRRWVVRAEAARGEALLEDFHRKVFARTGHDLSGQENFMLNAFGIQRYLAAAFFSGRLVLAGDSAHVMSPIGGQGMNVGWMDAWDLAGTLFRILRLGASPQQALGSYGRRGRRRARRRAAVYTTLGRRIRCPRLCLGLIRLLLQSPLEGFLARLFTMHGLRPLGALPETDIPPENPAERPALGCREGRG